MCACVCLAAWVGVYVGGVGGCGCMCACVCLAAWVGVHVCMRVSSCMGRGVCGWGGWVSCML